MLFYRNWFWNNTASIIPDYVYMVFKKRFLVSYFYFFFLRKTIVIFKHLSRDFFLDILHLMIISISPLKGAKGEIGLSGVKGKYLKKTKTKQSC